MRLWLEVRHKAVTETQTYGVGARLQTSQHAVIKTAAVAQAVAARAIAHTGHEQEAGHDLLGVFGFWNTVGILLHRAAGVPDVKSHGFVGFVHDRQGNASALRDVIELAVLFPSVQRGQGIEFAFYGPIGADGGVWSADQPNAHHPQQ